MKAEEIMTRDPRSVTPLQTVAEAVKVMQTEDCGIVPVVQSDGNLQVIGVITDRDIALRACRPDGHGPEEKIESVMTEHVFCVHPDDDITRVSQVMESAGIRRVPVVGRNNELMGIISIKDLADNLDDREIGRIDGDILGQKPNN
jgi:CBS domain-containing protein